MVKLTSLDLKKDKIETLALAACEDKTIYADPALNALVKQAKQLKEFSAKKDEALTLFDPPGIKAKRVIMVGLGQHKKLIWKYCGAWPARR